MPNPYESLISRNSQAYDYFPHLPYLEHVCLDPLNRAIVTQANSWSVRPAKCPGWSQGLISSFPEKLDQRDQSNAVSDMLSLAVPESKPETGRE
jgi:hypothetical protein